MPVILRPPARRENQPFCTARRGESRAGAQQERGERKIERGNKGRGGIAVENEKRGKGDREGKRERIQRERVRKT